MQRSLIITGSSSHFPQIPSPLFFPSWQTACPQAWVIFSLGHFFLRHLAPEEELPLYPCPLTPGPCTQPHGGHHGVKTDSREQEDPEQTPHPAVWPYSRLPWASHLNFFSVKGEQQSVSSLPHRPWRRSTEVISESVFKIIKY